MTDYVKHGPYTSGAPPGIDYDFLNDIEEAVRLAHVELHDHEDAAAPHSGHALAGHTHLVVRELVWAIEGNLVVGDNAAPLDHDTRDGVAEGMLIDVIGRVKNSPGGQAVIFNVAYSDDNGSNRVDLFAAGGRPQVAIGAKRGVSSSFNITSIPAGKRITVDVDQIGTGGSPGAKLLVYFRYYEACQAEA